MKHRLLDAAFDFFILIVGVSMLSGVLYTLVRAYEGLMKLMLYRGV